LQQITLPACALPPFDHTDLRWESWYGLTHHYWGERHRRPGSGRERDDLNAELGAIAEIVAGGPQAPIHRDYQSTNIHLLAPCAEDRDKEATSTPVPRLLDWCDIRRGPALYDLVSLLWDPYVDLSPGERQALLATWSGPRLHDDLLRATATQRLLQAIGAFAYLARHRNRPHFRPFAAAAERALSDLVTPWPTLSRIIRARP
jgi:aminoglycoside/choline kinase family phosphotransferase